MSDFASMFLPLLAFMLIPLWIPLIAVTLGWLQETMQREPVPIRPDRERWQRRR